MAAPPKFMIIVWVRVGLEQGLTRVIVLRRELPQLVTPQRPWYVASIPDLIVKDRTVRPGSSSQTGKVSQTVWTKGSTTITAV